MFKMTDKNINQLDNLNIDILGDPSIGGIVYFQGVVRNHNEGKKVISLEYECYETMANKIGREILISAKEKHPIVDAICVHRYGHLDINDTAVWVIVTSHHRDAAYQASQYIIDVVKSTVPIWKREHYINEEAKWVACHRCEINGKKHHEHIHNEHCRHS